MTSVPMPWPGYRFDVPGGTLAIYKYGDLDTLQHLENSDVYHYQRLLSAYPMDIFCIGSISQVWSIS